VLFVGDLGAVVVFRSPSGGGYGRDLLAAWTAHWEWPRVPAVGAALLVVVLASATPIALAAGLVWFVLWLGVAAIMYRRRTGAESGA
jgi:hypothetical protein